MITNQGKRLCCAVFTFFLLAFAGMGRAAAPAEYDAANGGQKLQTLNDKVRHELVMLPYFGVFDNLEFDIQDGGTVVLSGQVVRPMLKSDAEGVVRRIQGVGKVVNRIEVLPVSPFDDAIRLATYRAIFSRPGFEKYAVRVVSPISIIVKHGNITLDGFVGSKVDKAVAAMAARSVFGAFSVTDNLKVG